MCKVLRRGRGRTAAAVRAVGGRRQRVWGCAALAALVLAMPAPARAQAADTLVARIDSLLPQWRRAAEAAERADALRDRQRELETLARVDTVRIGPLRVLAAPEDTAAAREVFAEAWAWYAPFVGDSVRGASWPLFVFSSSHAAAEIYVRHPRVYLVDVRPWYGRRLVRENAQSAIGRALSDAMPAELREWAGASPPMELRGPSWVYRELAGTPSRAARLCFEGQTRWCWEAVGVTESEDPWRSWYTAEERRLLALATHTWNPEGAARVRACFDGSMEACEAVLERQTPRVPLSVAARTSLLVHALEAGGEDSYARLLATDASGVRERLARAARMDPDALMTAWRARVLAARPEAGEDLARRPWSTLFWVLAFAGLAMGSTRWRSA